MDGTVSVHMNIGQKLRIEVPVMLKGSFIHGHFALKDKELKINDTTKVVMNGFYLENDLVGSLEAVPNCVAVIYTHKQPFGNTIYFRNAGERLGIVSIIGVSVHDHSSVYQGGPAHGTYSSEVNLQATS